MLNQVQLIGFLGADPETRYLPDGGNVTNIRVATSENWKDKNTGERKEHTEWHNVSFFGRLGEIAAEYLRKGSKVFIQGKLQTRKWQDKDGNDRWTTSINAREMKMLDSKSDRPASGGTQAPQQQRVDSAPAAGEPDFDDDIPF